MTYQFRLLLPIFFQLPFQPFVSFGFLSHVILISIYKQHILHLFAIRSCDTTNLSLICFTKRQFCPYGENFTINVMSFSYYITTQNAGVGITILGPEKQMLVMAKFILVGVNRQIIPSNFINHNYSSLQRHFKLQPYYTILLCCIP